MSHLSLGVLLAILGVLILLSGFFSGSETGMMAVNRYRLRHLVRIRHRGAMRVSRLLERPDRLLGTILLGNTFINNLAAALTTVIAVQRFGEHSILISTTVLTIVILIFAEATPKTLAATHPERFAFIASWPMQIILKLFLPLVWCISGVSNGLLRLCGVKRKGPGLQLSQEELRTVVNEAGARIPKRHKTMLLHIFDLQKMTVDDIMVPRNEIIGIDLTDDWSTIVAQLNTSQHTRLPLFSESIDHVKGMLHLRDVLRLRGEEERNSTHLRKIASEAAYVPEGTPLTTQLINFQSSKQRTAFVVDEYGDIQGLVTLEDILEEIVGEFTTDMAAANPDVYPQDDGSYLVDASATVRELNRSMHWSLPVNGPKTLSGLIVEYLEVIPKPGTGLRIAGYPMEIIQITESRVKTVKIFPELRILQETSP